jgi:hypothetical protein
LQLLGGRIDEPLHLGHLLVLGERGRLELAVDPFLGLGFVRPGLARQRAQAKATANTEYLQFHCNLLRFIEPLCERLPRLQGEGEPGLDWKKSALAHDQPSKRHRQHKADPDRGLASRLIHSATSFSADADKGQVHVGAP